MPDKFDDALYDRVRRFIAEQTGENIDSITPETRLAQDLGVAGDDGEALLSAFQKQFAVNLDGVDSIKYFGGEHILDGVLAAVKRQAPLFKLVPLTVLDLYTAAKAGAWTPH